MTHEVHMPDEIPLKIKWARGRPVPLEPQNCEPHIPSPDGYPCLARVGRANAR